MFSCERGVALPGRRLPGRTTPRLSLPDALPLGGRASWAQPRGARQWYPTPFGGLDSVFRGCTIDKVRKKIPMNNVCHLRLRIVFLALFVVGMAFVAPIAHAQTFTFAQFFEVDAGQHFQFTNNTPVNATFNSTNPDLPNIGNV